MNVDLERVASQKKLGGNTNVFGAWTHHDREAVGAVEAVIEESRALSCDVVEGA